MCLASLVYHRQWLLEILPPAHKLRFSALFATPSMLNDLASKVVSQQDPCSEAGLGGSEPTVHAGDSIGPPTGIPPFILTAVEQRRHAKKIEALDHERNEGTDFC